MALPPRAAFGLSIDLAPVLCPGLTVQVLTAGCCLAARVAQAREGLWVPRAPPSTTRIAFPCLTAVSHRPGALRQRCLTLPGSETTPRYSSSKGEPKGGFRTQD